jgi:hypothetical protein
MDSSSDPNKKVPRTFQCREPLWQKFEQMARELECSVDYLINDAMKQYARQRGYSSTAHPAAMGIGPSTAGGPPAMPSNRPGPPPPPPPPAPPPPAPRAPSVTPPPTG